MSALDAAHFAMLEKTLEADFVPHLPPLLDVTQPPEQQRQKNRSRAFSAFALHHICDIPKVDAGRAVIDDFDDYGVDAIYYHAPTQTLYFVQSKLKAAEQFSQAEALAFCQGVRKLVKQDFSSFNSNVQVRAVEIENALDDCSRITLVVAHTGSGISMHAKEAIDELLADDEHCEDRFQAQPINYDAARVVSDLLAEKAHEKVNVDLLIYKSSHVEEPRVTYFGLVRLEDLVKLHEKHGNALYERNIRTFLGHKTEVNSSIQQTLATKPKEFLYLNNGVTALCEIIEPKSQKKGGKRLKVRGLAVVNGAQTIASSASFVAENKGSNISDAKVSLTLIKAKADGDFGKEVTRARNHQNPVMFWDFAALDDEQERLRRELAHLGIHYAYKAGAADAAYDPARIQIDEAVQALALFQTDPRHVVWLKKEPARFLDTASDQYKAIFSPALTPFQLANAVRFNRYAQNRIAVESRHAAGQDRLIYRHGNYAVAWVLAKRVSSAVNSAALIDEGKLSTELSGPFDQIRQTHLEKTKAALPSEKGPLALFRNQADVLPLVQNMAIEHYGLSTDPVIDHKKKQQKTGQPYPEDLFTYLVSKAPQIGNLK
jgi:hypothetical protein